MSFAAETNEGENTIDSGGYGKECKVKSSGTVRKGTSAAADGF